MSLSERINDIRKQKKLSIDELSAMSNIPKGTLSKITAGITQNPSIETVRAIATALRCSLDDFDDSPRRDDLAIYPHNIESFERGFPRNLAKLLMENQHTVADLAGSLSFPRSTVFDWLDGKKIPGKKMIELLSRYFHVSQPALLGEEIIVRDTKLSISPHGQLIGHAYDKAPQREQDIVEHVLGPFMPTHIEVAGEMLPTNAEKVVDFPVFDQPAAAGFGNYLDEATYEVLSFPQNQVPVGTGFGVRISGDSMEPDIEDESIVFVEERLAIDSGQIGIFILNGDAYCKKLILDYTRSGQRRVRLISLNPAYDDIHISEDDDLRTVGRVLGMAAMRTAD